MLNCTKYLRAGLINNNIMKIVRHILPCYSQDIIKSDLFNAAHTMSFFFFGLSYKQLHFILIVFTMSTIYLCGIVEMLP